MSHQPDNIFAGTQVVALIEVRGPGNSLVHPRGTVGVVTRTPAVTGEQYLVHFPDGFGASFPHEQLEVLKHFRDRRGSSAGILPAGLGRIPAPRSEFTDSKQGCFDHPPAGSPRYREALRAPHSASARYSGAPVSDPARTDLETAAPTANPNEL